MNFNLTLVKTWNIYGAVQKVDLYKTIFTFYQTVITSVIIRKCPFRFLLFLITSS